MKKYIRAKIEVVNIDEEIILTSIETDAPTTTSYKPVPETTQYYTSY